jgi:2-oxoglutarate ferredoxin oxidoreductase subunit alpha
LVPGPRIRTRHPQSCLGAIFFGTTTDAAYEAINSLGDQGIAINSLRKPPFL